MLVQTALAFVCWVHADPVADWIRDSRPIDSSLLRFAGHLLVWHLGVRSAVTP